MNVTCSEEEINKNIKRKRRSRWLVMDWEAIGINSKVLKTDTHIHIRHMLFKFYVCAVLIV